MIASIFIRKTKNLPGCWLLLLLLFTLKGYAQTGTTDAPESERVISHPLTPYQLLMGSWMLEDIKYSVLPKEMDEEGFNLLVNAGMWTFHIEKLELTDAEGTKKMLPYTFAQWIGMGAVIVKDFGKKDFLFEMEQVSNHELRLFYKEKSVSLHFIRIIKN